MLNAFDNFNRTALINVNKGLNTNNIYSYLETPGGQSYYTYLNVIQFFITPVLTRHLWQLKTAVFQHR